jgi:hypothetical protein
MTIRALTPEEQQVQLEKLLGGKLVPLGDGEFIEETRRQMLGVPIVRPDAPDAYESGRDFERERCAALVESATPHAKCSCAECWRLRDLAERIRNPAIP